MSKAYNLSFEYVLYELSYTNLIMYSSVIPSYTSPKEKEKNKEGKNEVIDMNDPRNDEKVDKLFEHFY